MLLTGEANTKGDAHRKKHKATKAKDMIAATGVYNARVIVIVRHIHSTLYRLLSRRRKIG